MVATPNANANLVGVSNGTGGFNYTVTLSNTGATTIGTFWFGWVPGQDFLTQNPFSIGSPNGWSEAVVPIGPGYSIEWTANSAASYIQPAASSSAFTFSSTETPTEMAANTPLAVNTPSITSFVYAAGALVSAGQQITATVGGTSSGGTTENASATMASAEIAPGAFQYTITLTDTGDTTVGTFWFAWDDVPDQDFMSAQPFSVGSPSGWSDQITTHSYPGGTGYGILWSANSAVADLNPNDVSSSFTFISTETPQQFAAVSPFDDTFQSTSSFVYQQGAEQTPGGNFVVAVACFREGTRIRTPSGDRMIETLRPGDEVLTASGDARPVRWTGRRHVRCHSQINPRQSWPIRVARDALAPGVPSADLYLSPDHALFLDGVLVPVKHLLNQTTIASIPVDAVTWHHLELDSHDVILAEGAPAETYLDTGDRAQFNDSVIGGFDRAATRLDPGTARETASFAPVVVTGPILAGLRRRLASRTARLARFLPPSWAA